MVVSPRIRISHILPLVSLLLVQGCAESAKLASLATVEAPAAQTEPQETFDRPSSARIAAEPLLQDLNPEDIAISQARAKRNYLNHWPIVAERSRYVRQRLLAVLEQLQAPPALQLIPVVESGYNPYALSHAGAMGLWQLMPRTARDLGIRNRHGYDGRRNVEEATTAAVRYLLDLRHRFDSWPLAIAAYHMGPYGLARRLKSHPWRAADGLEAMPVPGMTRAYVRHVLGLAALLKTGVIRFPEAYATAPVTLEPPVDVARLGPACGLNGQDIFLFNPGLNQAQYLNEPVTIHLPAEALPVLSERLQFLGPKYVKTTVRKGDSLWRIASQHHIPVARLKWLNPGLGHLLHPGQQLVVPANRLARATAAPNPLLSKGRRIRYRVRSGDSLWSIARRFGTSATAIARSNQLSRKALIRPGDTLWILARIRPS